MTEPVITNLPSSGSALPAWIVGIPSALVPSSLKALDRLIGAIVDYPIALIKRETTKIEAQARAFEIVESAIAKSAGELAGADTETIGRALKILVRKGYRKQSNLEFVAAETVSELKAEMPFDTEEPSPKEPPNEDWLNVFERFAEDASTERMQRLWGRVLAGEIRQPGRFSLRTLRFLSEFSQSDAILFAEICLCAVGQFLPKSLVMPEEKKDIRDLMQLEAAGLMSDASGPGLKLSFTFDTTGYAYLREENLCLALCGEPNTEIVFNCLSLTPLGVEVMSLIPNRDSRGAIRRVAQAIKSPQIKAAFIGHLVNPTDLNFIEQLWLNEA